MISNGINAIKDIQVGLLESNLYKSTIDGVWGGGSVGGINTLITATAKRESKTAPTGLFAGSSPASVVKDVQTAMTVLGYFTGPCDGVMGDDTTLSFYRLCKAYRQANNLPEYNLCWSKKVDDEFISQVQAWSNSVGFGLRGAYYAINIMGFESAGSFNPAKQNQAGAQAFGLLQFMAGAASDMGTTVDALKSMTQLQQLQYVFKYFNMRMKQYGKFQYLDDFYLSVFYPKAIGKNPNEKIFVKGQLAYTQNGGLDGNNDGVITIQEISQRIYDYYYQGMLLANRRTL